MSKYTVPVALLCLLLSAMALVFLEAQGLNAGVAIIIWVVELALVLGVVYQEEKAAEEEKKERELRRWREWERKQKNHDIK